jgi:hypothetical protein
MDLRDDQVGPEPAGFADERLPLRDAADDSVLGFDQPLEAVEHEGVGVRHQNSAGNPSGPGVRVSIHGESFDT